MTTSERWITAIRRACSEPNLARSNELITTSHYLLSEALANRLGRECGPNFHTWAVWGSHKAGVTIRQEDLGSAIRNATITAGAVGAIVGAATGVVAGRSFTSISLNSKAAIGACLGMLTGRWTGQRIAIWSREKAAQLVLDGNRAVIEEIGEQSARFLEMIEDGATVKGRESFFDGLRRGATERHGQDRLARAFRLYLAAYDSNDLAEKRASMVAGNCEIVYHEHIRLEPYIRGAMPWIVRRCATQRLMTYQVGEKVLSVGEDIPGLHTPVAARNWTRIEERMRYVFALFREFHTAPEVFSAPCPDAVIAHHQCILST